MISSKPKRSTPAETISATHLAKADEVPCDSDANEVCSRNRVSLMLTEKAPNEQEQRTDSDNVCKRGTPMGPRVSSHRLRLPPRSKLTESDALIMRGLETRPLLDGRVAWPANRLSGPRRLSARLGLGRSGDGGPFRMVGRGRRVKGEGHVGRSSDSEGRISLILGDCGGPAIDDRRLAVGLPNGDGGWYIIGSVRAMGLAWLPARL